ncbi:MAG TPA: SDR family oxidoreductase [Saprospiraceae bacterium]|nr:SDR family oxidoreductase [Saprospiraceae bacterium]
MPNTRVALITGCNTGIGKHTAIELAKQGYEVVMLVRDSDKSRAAQEEIKKASSSDEVQLFYVDLASLASIREVVDRLKQNYTKVDLLINNAGILKREEVPSADGFELSIAVNYMAPFYLTQLLLPLIQAAEAARIINLSSEMYKRGKVRLDQGFSAEEFDGIQAYSDSKLLLIYYTKSLAKRLMNQNITVNALHPGVIGTDVFREYPNWLSSLVGLFIASPKKGAQPSIYLATSDEVKAVSGAYFNKKQQTETISKANDEELAENIWSKTEALIESRT